MTTAASQRTSHDGKHDGDRELSITVQVDQIAETVTGAITKTGRALTAKGGLPLYAGLGLLAAADVIAWPVAAAAGVGYAVLRRWNPFHWAGLGPATDGTGGKPAKSTRTPARAAAPRAARATGTSRARASGGGARATGTRGTGSRAGASRGAGTRSTGSRGAGTRGTGSRAAGRASATSGRASATRGRASAGSGRASGAGRGRGRAAGGGTGGGTAG